MRNYSFVLILMMAFQAFAGDKLFIYENEESCKIQISEYGPNYYLITAAKKINGALEQIQFELAKDFTSTNSSYCLEEGGTIIYDENLVMSCNNERARMEMDLSFEDMSLSFVDVQAYHYNFLKKVDDSFQCEHLELTEILDLDDK